MASDNPTIDLSKLVGISIREDLPMETVNQVLSNPPFIPVALALNLRTVSSQTLASNIVYRSGALSHLPATSLSLLKSALGIVTIFDLRSRGEREKHPSPEVDGIKTVWIPSSIDIEPNASMLETATTKGVLEKDKLSLQGVELYDFVTNDGEPGYISMYTNILKTHKEPYKAVFQELKDGQGGILFHCTAGKDRTGVLAALIHALLDSPEDIVALDYGMTRVGVEPFKEMLLGTMLERMGRGSEMTLQDLVEEVPGFEAMAGVRGPTILAFLRSLNKNYGSAIGYFAEGNILYSGAKCYLVEELGFSVEDLNKIRQRLVVHS